MMDLHERLSQLLEQEQIKKVDLAKKLGVASQTVSPWFKPSRNVCDESYLTRLVAEVFEKLPADDRVKTLAELLVMRLKQRVRPEDLENVSGAWQLFSEATEMLENLLPDRMSAKRTGRTLADFPEAFYPLTVVTGDKRVDTERLISAADFGAVSASPAETRWISKMQLGPDVEFLTDKLFVLESIEELRERFGKRNLLVIGSPASNHLSRRIHKAPVDAGWRRGAPLFRFNIPGSVYDEIEQFLAGLKGLNRKQLVGVQANEETERKIKQFTGFFFQGGIFCPAGGDAIRGVFIQQERDFGLVTVARNPFAESDEFISVVVAGFHMMGTAHAVRMLADSRAFESHPYGGVVRVDIDLEKGFGTRFDDSIAQWDTGDASSYSLEELRTGLTNYKGKQSELAQYIDPVEFDESLGLLDAL